MDSNVIFRKLVQGKLDILKKTVVAMWSYLNNGYLKQRLIEKSNWILELNVKRKIKQKAEKGTNYNEQDFGRFLSHVYLWNIAINMVQRLHTKFI